MSYGPDAENHVGDANKMVLENGQPTALAGATGSDSCALQFLTSSGWQTYRELDSESLAIAHFFAVGKANVWTGHVRILHGERVVKSTLHPNIAGEP